MKDKIKYIVIGVVIILLLLILFLLKGKTNKNFLTYGEITSTIENSDFSAIYFGKEDESSKKMFANFKEIYGFKTYYSDASLKELNNLLSKAELSTNTTDVYVLFANATPKLIIQKDDDIEILKSTIEKELFNRIPQSEIKYKIADDASSIAKLVRSNNYTVLVFGYDSCNYCKLYLPVINKIAEDYKTDIYYFNRDTYDPGEYAKVLSLDLSIPAKCTLDNIATSTNETFPKPMTLITKNGKTVDCIKGYVETNTVVDKLKEYKIIKG
jgi:thiol-disulfide isomerase/thioredoxin